MSKSIYIFCGLTALFFNSLVWAERRIVNVPQTQNQVSVPVLNVRGSNTQPVPQVKTPPVPNQQYQAPTNTLSTFSNGQRQIRKVSSANEKLTGRVRTRRGNNVLDPDRETDIRLGLLGGYSMIQTTDSATQSFRDEQKLGPNYLVGLTTDVRLNHYYGAELDGYYGIAPQQTIIFDDQETQKKKLQHTGGMLNLKGQYPAWLGSWRFVPKLGAGYGMLMLKQSTESQLLGDTIDASETLKGIYGTVGFDIEPVWWLMFSADYARSLSASGTFSVKSASASGDASLTGVNFDRIRVGVLFRVQPNTMVGVHYTRRAMNFDVGSDGSAASDEASLLDVSNTEALSQFSASILFLF